jgi:hypothetical protein
VLLWEIRAGISSGDFRGIWADGRPAASTIWFHVWGGPNLCYYFADDCGSASLVTKAGTQQQLNAECMQLGTSGTGPVNGMPRSLHVGGVNAFFSTVACALSAT